MDTTRFILIVALSLVILLLWEAWQRDYGQPPVAEERKPETAADAQPVDVPRLSPDEADTPVPTKTEPGRNGEKLITVNTDVFRLQIDRQGGSIVHAELLHYPVSLDKPDEPVSLLDTSPQKTHIVQGGLLGDMEVPTHTSRFTSPADEYSLLPGQDALEVALDWAEPGPISVRKIYRLRKGSYLIDVRHELTNKGTGPWSGMAYGQLQRTGVYQGLARTVYTYTGAIISSVEKRYEKIAFDDIREKKLDRKITDGWAAMIEHYFLSAIIPGNSAEDYHYYTLYLDQGSSAQGSERFVIGATTPPQSVAPGARAVFDYRFYLGPKLQDELKTIAPGLDLTVDYGALWFIAKPLFWCLKKFHAIAGNWGWAIVLVTLMLKILFYHLSAAGYRSMANMRRIQPRLLALRDRYKNDRARLNQAMMEIYKQEKINPLGGCFPILIQIPVFIALYWVLLESVELRQAEFIGWINDLSGPDPYFVLPVVMGITMFVQQKLNPAPMDPVQEKVMMTLPVVFTVFFAFFPSGLVLYWVVNNILSIAQQWLIMRNLEHAGLKT